MFIVSLLFKISNVETNMNSFWKHVNLGNSITRLASRKVKETFPFSTFYSRHNILVTWGLWTKLLFLRLVSLSMQTFIYVPDTKSFNLLIFPSGYLLSISPFLNQARVLIIALSIQKFFQSTNIYWVSLCSSHRGK